MTQVTSLTLEQKLDLLLDHIRDTRGELQLLSHKVSYVHESASFLERRMIQIEKNVYLTDKHLQEMKHVRGAWKVSEKSVARKMRQRLSASKVSKQLPLPLPSLFEKNKKL